MAAADKQAVRVALLGCGNVGAEVVRLLHEQEDDLRARIGAPLEVAGIAVRRVGRDRGPLPIDPSLFTADALGLIKRDDVDIVVEVGGAGTLAQSIKATRIGGHISLIGVLAGQHGEVNPLPAVMKGIRIQGIYVGSREMFEAMNRAIGLHGIRPAIDRVFPFDQVRQAFRHLESGAHIGKVVITI